MEYPKEKRFEDLARIEHERWASWQKYFHSKCVKIIDVDDKTGEETLREVTIPIKYYKNLERLIETTYKDLSEKEKDSDREQVMRYWNII